MKTIRQAIEENTWIAQIHYEDEHAARVSSSDETRSYLFYANDEAIRFIGFVVGVSAETICRSALDDKGRNETSIRKALTS